MDIIKYTEYDEINEFQIPNVKLDEFLYNIKFANKVHKNTILTHYNTFEQYVDLIDKKKHLFKVNDLSGDILNSERVVFKAIVFDKADIDNIKENVITYALSDFYIDIPDTLDILGIQLKPITFIDKDAVKTTFEQIITFDQTISIISELSKFKYVGELNGFYIWSDKQPKQVDPNKLMDK
jgi:hypothetical protein